MKNNKSVLFTVIALFLIIIAVFLWILLNGKETRTSNSGDNESISVLYCSTNGIEDAFFTSETANTIKNEMKITFKGDKLDKIFYAYNGAYRSTEVAQEDEARLHAKYNIYMGENDISQEDLSPSYAVTSSKLHLTLYVEDYNKINLVTSVFFFIDEDEINKYKNYSIDEMKSFYEEKNFKCQINK